MNTTIRNCLFQGNIYQRFEHWNFGDYWGTGQDSIIDWNPWPPTFPRTIAFPGIGVYQVTLLDSNYCGIDTAHITITIVPPPDVTLALSPDTICAGETAFLDETMTGGANSFGWNYDEGAGWQTPGPGDQAHPYSAAGTYTIGYAASIAGATSGCTDTAYVVLVVLPSPTAQFNPSVNAACDSLTTTFTNTSISALSNSWDFGDGTFFSGPNPPAHSYNTVGDYTVTLTVTSVNGCTDQMSQLIHVYAPPQVNIGAQNVCVGDAAQFTDMTVTATGNPVIQWLWDFGDGSTDTTQNPLHLYSVAGPYLVTLTSTTPYCSGTGTQPVLVEAKPTAAFTANPVLACSPTDVAFTNTSSGAIAYSWDFGDGSSSTSTSPTHTYVNPGTIDSVYTVNMIASTAFGRSATMTMHITVAPLVVAQRHARLRTHGGGLHQPEHRCQRLRVGFRRWRHQHTAGAHAHLHQQHAFPGHLQRDHDRVFTCGLFRHDQRDDHRLPRSQLRLHRFAGQRMQPLRAHLPLGTRGDHL